MDKTISDKIKQDLINTGIFLESDTYQLFKKWNSGRTFDAFREYPYTSGRGTFFVDGTLDILAVTSIQDHDLILLLPIECKKADPQIKHWVFEPHRPSRQKQLEFMMSVKGGIRYYCQWYNLPGLGYNTYTDYENCVNVFEFSEVKGNLSRNKEKELRAYYAIKQANESVPGIVDRIPKLSRNVAFHNVIIPIVVTTANLWITDYDPAKIVKESGELSKDDLKLTPKNWVIYSYPVPFHESVDGTLLEDGKETGSIMPTKRLTFIVNSGSLNQFVDCLIGDLNSYYEPDRTYNT